MRAVLALGLLGFASLAQAQDLPRSEPKLTIAVSTEEAMLIVQTLGAIGCRTVSDLTMCQTAADLLRSIREQVKKQGR